jgi:PAS domain S-box-containing protein
VAHISALDGSLREVLARLIVEHSADGIIAVGEDGSILAFNGAAETMFGYAESDIVGRDLSMLVSTGPERPREGSGQAVSPHETDLDRGTIGLRRNGETFPLRFIVSQAVADGRPFSAVVTRDITEQVALAESEALHRVLTEASGDIIARVDGAGVYRYVSPASTRILGRRPDELIGTSWVESLHPDDLPIQTEVTRRLLAGERSITITARKQHRDGHYVWLETVITAEIDEHTGWRVFTVSRDVTDRKRVEAELEESRRFLGSLIESVAAAIYRCANDADWTMQFISDEIQVISGYPASDFIDNAVRSYDSSWRTVNGPARWSTRPWPPTSRIGSSTASSTRTEQLSGCTSEAVGCSTTRVRCATSKARSSTTPSSNSSTRRCSRPGNRPRRRRSPSRSSWPT